MHLCLPKSGLYCTYASNSVLMHKTQSTNVLSLNVADGSDNGGHLISPPPEEMTEEAIQRLRQQIMALQSRLQASSQVHEENALLKDEVQRLTALVRASRRSVLLNAFVPDIYSGSADDAALGAVTTF